MQLKENHVCLNFCIAGLWSGIYCSIINCASLYHASAFWLDRSQLTVVEVVALEIEGGYTWGAATTWFR